MMMEDIVKNALNSVCCAVLDRIFAWLVEKLNGKFLDVGARRGIIRYKILEI